MTLERKHYYKVYRDGIYLGLLPNVRSDFSYSQEINTGATITLIEVAQSLDNAADELEPLETEAGEIITTENEQVITTERATEIVGGKDSGRLIANGNDIEVWEYSDDDPNGVIVFSGYQSKMRAKLGTEDVLVLNVISYGKDLDDYIYGTGTFTLQLSQTTFNDWDFSSRPDQPSLGTDIHGQSFTGLAFTLSKIAVQMALGDTFQGIYPTSANVTLKLYSGDPLTSYTLLDTVIVTITNVYSNWQFIDFILSTPVLLSSSTNYFYTIQTSDYVQLAMSWGANPYANGDAYSGEDGVLDFRFGGGYPNPYDFCFKLYSGGSATDAVFTGDDPAQMVRDAVTGYQAQGGVVTYTGGSITDSGLSLDYEFIMATPLEIIKKARELAGANYYWYVDPATQVLTFKPTAATATHRLILGRHLEEFEIESTIEHIRNVVYFTGGPTAGVNLLKKYTDIASLAVNRLGMERLTDNRIVAANVVAADTLADNFMEENSDEIFTADPVTVPADTYDIDTINLGDTIGFQGFGNFIDSIVFQITVVQRSADRVVLTLGKLPLSASTYIDEIKRKLENEQTLDNPSTPS